jgi:hypothetical protein
MLQQHTAQLCCFPQATAKLPHLKQMLPSAHHAICIYNHATKLNCVHAAVSLMLKLPSPTCCRPFAVHLECQQPDSNEVGHLSQHKQRVMILDGAPEDQQRLGTTPVKQCTGWDKQLPKKAHTPLPQVRCTAASNQDCNLAARKHLPPRQRGIREPTSLGKSDPSAIVRLSAADP